MLMTMLGVCVAGFLVPPNDPVSLAQKVEQLMLDRKLLNSMQKNALKRVNKYFTWYTVADMVNTLYQCVRDQAMPVRAQEKRQSYRNVFALQNRLKDIRIANG